jgi:hypothetical protein
VSIPTQFGTDVTPVVIEYNGYGDAACADALKVKADASDYSKANPPQRLENAPTTEPVCEKSVGGVSVRVWGTTAATYVCASLK